MAATVVAVHRSSRHSFSKFAEDSITLVVGLGGEGDAHAGATVKHRSRVKRDPAAPNLRQVHLIQSELFDALVQQGHAVFPGEMGENVTTRGVNLLGLPVGTRLRLGAQALVELTGLRNPCSQIDAFQAGLMSAVLERDDQGRLVRKAGVMAVVLQGGTVAAGDAVQVVLPEGVHRALEPV